MSFISNYRIGLSNRSSFLCGPPAFSVPTKGKSRPWLGVALHFCLVNLTQLQVPLLFRALRFFFPMLGLHLKSLLSSQILNGMISKVFGGHIQSWQKEAKWHTLHDVLISLYSYTAYTIFFKVQIIYMYSDDVSEDWKTKITFLLLM